MSWAVTISLSLLLIPQAAVASPADAGEVHGRIWRTAGQPQAAASLTLVSRDSGRTFELETDADGRFRRTGLPLGRYELSFSSGEKDERWAVPIHLTLVQPVMRIEVDIEKLQAAAAAYRRFQEELVTKSVETTRRKQREAGFARRHRYVARMLREGKHLAALEALDDMLREVPDREGLAALRASALASNGRTTEAIETYRALIAAGPREASNHNNLALLLARQGLVDEAVRHLQQAISFEKQRAATYTLNLGSVYFNAGRFDEASEQFRVSIKRDPTNPDAHYFHGLSLLQAGKSDGDRSRAVLSIHRYLQLEPEGAFAEQARDHLEALSRGDTGLLLPDVRDREDFE